MHTHILLPKMYVNVCRFSVTSIVSLGHNNDLNQLGHFHADRTHYYCFSHECVYEVYH